MKAPPFKQVGSKAFLNNEPGAAPMKDCPESSSEPAII
jgi:hypothetical protein